MSETVANFICVIAGGILGFGLTVGFYSLKQRRMCRHAKQLHDELTHRYGGSTNFGPGVSVIQGIKAWEAEHGTGWRSP